MSSLDVPFSRVLEETSEGGLFIHSFTHSLICSFIQQLLGHIVYSECKVLGIKHIVSSRSEDEYIRNYNSFKSGMVRNNQAIMGIQRKGT